MLVHHTTNNNFDSGYNVPTSRDVLDAVNTFHAAFDVEHRLSPITLEFTNSDFGCEALVDIELLIDNEDRWMPVVTIWKDGTYSLYVHDLYMSEDVEDDTRMTLEEVSKKAFETVNKYQN